MDDIFLFLDHWVIVRPDGNPILNGTPEQFEEALRRLIGGQSELKDFLYNVEKEARKGYYTNNEAGEQHLDEQWIAGYCNAIQDVSERIEEEVSDELC